jgi:hypothetical protein
MLVLTVTPSGQSSASSEATSANNVQNQSLLRFVTLYVSDTYTTHYTQRHDMPPYVSRGFPPSCRSSRTSQ